MLGTTPIHSWEQEGEVYATAIGYGDSLIAAANATGLIHAYDVETKEQTRLRTAHKGSPVFGIEFHRSDPLLISCGQDGVRLGYLVGESPVPQITNKSGRGQLCAAVHPDVTRFATGGFGGTITIFDILTGEPTHHFSAHANATSRLAFVAEGKVLLSCGYDGKVCAWDPYAGKKLFELDAHQEECYAVEPTLNGECFVTTGKDRRVKVWDLATLSAREIGSTKACPTRARVHPRGEWVGVTAEDGTVSTYHVDRSGDALQVMKAHDGTAYDIAYARGGGLAVTGGADRSVKLWRVG